MGGGGGIRWRGLVKGVITKLKKIMFFKPKPGGGGGGGGG